MLQISKIKIMKNWNSLSNVFDLRTYVVIRNYQIFRFENFNSTCLQIVLFRESLLVSVSHDTWNDAQLSSRFIKRNKCKCLNVVYCIRMLWLIQQYIVEVSLVSYLHKKICAYRFYYTYSFSMKSYFVAIYDNIWIHCAFD